MISEFDYLRELNTASVIFRLVLAMFFGGILGLERGSKHRPAGFRTHMLVCLGAALTMIMGQYEHYMLENEWFDIALTMGVRVDVSRFGAQVINGIGFLGAGTVLVTSKKEEKGLTTAAALWASACMGLAVGAGFYECVVLGFILIFMVTKLLPIFEAYVIENSTCMSLHIEFRSLDDLGKIVSKIKEQDVIIYDMMINRGREEKSTFPTVVFALGLHKRKERTRLMVSLSEVKEIYLLEEI